MAGKIKAPFGAFIRNLNESLIKLSFFAQHAEALVELLDTTTGVHNTLFAGIKRVTL